MTWPFCEETIPQLCYSSLADCQVLVARNHFFIQGGVTPCSHDNEELDFGETKGSTVSQVALQEEMDTLDILTIYGLEYVAVQLQVLWRKWDIFRVHGSSACRFGGVYSPKELGPLTLGGGGSTDLLSNTDCTIAKRIVPASQTESYAKCF